MEATHQDLLAFSEYALEQSKQENEYSNQYLRTSIHKAYYSSYHPCKKIADMLPETEKVKGGMHQQVIDKLLEVPTSSLKKHSNKKELKTIAVLLLQSKDLRTKADYNLEENIDPREAEQHLRNTKKILSRSENVYNSMTQKVLSA